MANYPKELRPVILDGICTQSLITLVGGPILAAFLVLLGANHFWIGVAAGIPPLAQLIQIPAILVVEKVRKRRTICVTTSLLSRMVWVPAIVSIFLGDAKMTLTLSLLAITLQASIGAICGTSWNSWMRDLVPIEIMGSFFSHRMKLATTLSMFLLIFAGIVLEKHELFNLKEIQSFGIVFAVGLSIGFLGLFFLGRIPDPKLRLSERNHPLWKRLIAPLKDPAYRPTVIFLSAWNFSINLAIPFFVVYLMKRLGFGMGAIIGLAIISQLANILAFPMWGKFIDHFSNKTVLAVTGPIFLLVILMWPFTTLPDQYMLTIPLLIIIHVVGGFSTAGTFLAAGNIALKQAPEGEATAYLAINSVISSISMFIAPIIGGTIAHFFAVSELSFTLTWTSPGTFVAFQTLNFQELDFLFFIAAILGFIVIQILAFVKEDGEASEKILMRELRGIMQRNILNISTVTGFRFLVSFPYNMLRLPVHTFKKFRNKIATVRSKNLRKQR
ncbi:MFS transporter [bacterium]|nr:MFS transporter [bacterium]